MTLNIYFCIHTSEAFTPVFDKLFSTATIVVIENAFSNPSDAKWEEAYNRLSRKEIHTNELLKHANFQGVHPTEIGFWKGIADKICSAPVKTIVLEHSPLGPQEFQTYKQLRNLDALTGTLDNVLADYQYNMSRVADFQRERNKNLAKQLTELSDANPEGEVMLVMGAGHQTGLEHNLKTAGVPFSSFCTLDSKTVDLDSLLLTALENGKKPSQRDVEMALIHTLRNGDLEKVSMHTHAERLKVRSQIESMTDSERRDYLKFRFPPPT